MQRITCIKMRWEESGLINGIILSVELMKNEASAVINLFHSDVLRFAENSLRFMNERSLFCPLVEIVYLPAGPSYHE